ncbi:MAG: glycosyltransferase [Kiritimatiellae bacterium]|nr:glycosyltransferase [Kiritimatiellia bacterium]
MTVPVASVIVPCRNVEKTVEAALAGPLASPLRELEVIAVDDGSTDGTFSVLERIAAKDGRVVVLHSGGKGVSAARNMGLDAARGEFVFFVDADDVVEPDMYPKVVEAMRRDRADYCRVAHEGRFVLTGKELNFPLKGDYRFSSNEEIIEKLIPCFFGYSLRQVVELYAGVPLFARREMGSVCTGGFRLSLIRDCDIRFDETIEIYEDAMFLSEYLIKSQRTTIVDESLYHYMLSVSGSMLSKTSGPEFFANKLRLLAKREELDVKSGGRLTSMYAASCVFSLLEILRASFRIKGCLFRGLSVFRRYGSDPVVKVALRHFPLSWRKPVLAAAVLACRFISPLFFRAKQ